MGEVFAGRYELVDPIARGGAGAVWRAWDHRRRRYVAAKVLLHSDAHSLLRFVREQALRIDHPHVLAPASWAADDDKVLFTMDLVAGGSLVHLVNDYGPLPPAYVCTLLDQLLSGLSAVHGEGVVHRDIKPANILLEATGRGRPRLRLSDFGIAMRLGEPRLTQTDYMVGTPGYVAPEQLLGADPDYRADLFAVGLVALYLLEGAKPDTKALVEHFAEHGTPNAPQGIPEPLWEVVATLLQPDPEARFRTATGARKALATAVELLPGGGADRGAGTGSGAGPDSGAGRGPGRGQGEPGDDASGRSRSPGGESTDDEPGERGGDGGDPRGRDTGGNGSAGEGSAASDGRSADSPVDEPVEIFDQLGPLPEGFGPDGPLRVSPGVLANGKATFSAPADVSPSGSPFTPSSAVSGSAGPGSAGPGPVVTPPDATPPRPTHPPAPVHPPAQLPPHPIPPAAFPPTPVPRTPVPLPPTPVPSSPVETLNLRLPPPVPPGAPAAEAGETGGTAQPDQPTRTPPEQGPPQPRPQPHPGSPATATPSPRRGRRARRRPGPPAKVTLAILLAALACYAVGFWALTRI